MYQYLMITIVFIFGGMAGEKPLTGWTATRANMGPGPMEALFTLQTRRKSTFSLLA
jgi:hypothetical protein